MSKIEKVFQNGEVLYADDLNQVVNAVNDNADKIEENKEDIQDNERAIQANTEAIQQQGQTIAQHGQAITAIQEKDNQQDNTIQQQGQTLTQHGNAIQQQGQAIVTIQEKDGQQDHTIQQQGEAIALLQQTTGQQGEALNGIAQRIGEITAAGYSLVGVISTNINPPAPASGLKVYYIALTGTYTHFGESSMVVPEGAFGLIMYNESWSLELIPTGDAAFINVNKCNSQSVAYASAAAARAAVPAGLRKPGLQITYLLDAGWMSDQYVGADVADWGVADNWKVIGPVSVTQNTEMGILNITVGEDSVETVTAASLDSKTGIQTFSIENDTVQAKEWVGKFYKGQRVVVSADANNTVSVYFFLKKTDGTYQKSIEVPAGTTKTIYLSEDGIAVRLYHSNNSVWTASMIVYGLLYTTQDVLKVQPNIGYYVCINGENGNKEVNNIAFFDLISGGTIKVKFLHKNALAAPTLNINNTGAKQFCYNGAPVSPSNTWEDGETVFLYYDPSGNNGDGVWCGYGSSYLSDLKPLMKKVSVEVSGSSSKNIFYPGYYKKNQRLTITTSSENTKDILVFGKKTDGTFTGSLGATAPGKTSIITFQEDFIGFQLWHEDTSVWSANVVVEGLIESNHSNIEAYKVANAAELSNIYAILSNIIGQSTISVTGDTNKYKDWQMNLQAGRCVDVSASANNTKDLYFFYKSASTGDWVRPSIQVPIGTTKKIVIPENATAIRLWHEDTSAWSVNIVVYGLLDSMAYQMPVVLEDIEDIKSQLAQIPSQYYKDKKLVTLGDSYSAQGKWQTKLASIKGFDFNAVLNNHRYSVGGSTTLSENGECGQYRAIRVVSDGQIIPDVIIVENVNDGNLLSNAGTSTDSPYMMNTRVDLEISPAADESAAETYFANNIASILSGVTAVHGYRVGIPYITGNNASILTFNSAPLSDGTLEIRTGNVVKRTINVSSTDTIADVIAKITELAWHRYDLYVSGDSVKFTPILNTTLMPDYNVTIVSNTTGMDITVQNDQQGTLYAVMTYPLHDMTNWNNAGSWVRVNTITLWSAYKGLFNYLSEHFPLAEIFFMFPLVYYVDVESSQYQYPDGNIDTDKVRAKVMYDSLKTAQKAICEYCEVPFWDLKEYACIYPQNVAQYFPANNYHPNDAGYARWGIACAKFLL